MTNPLWKLFKWWCDTGRRITVDDIKGDGWVAPGTCSSRTYHVYRFFGREWVAVGAAEDGQRNVDNAKFWFHRFGVWGSGEGTSRAIAAAKAPGRWACRPPKRGEMVWDGVSRRMTVAPWDALSDHWILIPTRPTPTTAADA